MCRAWEQAGQPLTVAINVSMPKLLDPEFPESVKTIVARSSADPHRLKLEITESAIMAEPRRVLETMNRLRQLGVGFSIDDFGTGYSSLAYLQRLPVEEIKIDRSFVGQLSADAGSAAIVRATATSRRASGWTLSPKASRTTRSGRFCTAWGASPPRDIS
jgi:EAL domain-containing protein (putative c-di-GMP-specific phosphodiesterase class I)